MISPIRWLRRNKRNLERALLKRLTVSPRYQAKLRKRMLDTLADPSQPLRLIVGGGPKIAYRGWHLTDQETLDLLLPEQWEKLFGQPRIDAMLAEHVWEHLTWEQGLGAASLCCQYMKPGAIFRVAVPDGYHPSPEYIRRVEPGGTGSAAADHKILHTYQTFSKMFQEAGFEVRLLEYWDENQVFHHEPFSFDDGRINRRPLFAPTTPALTRDATFASDPALSPRAKLRPAGNELYNTTSLILDAIKPANPNRSDS